PGIVVLRLAVGCVHVGLLFSQGRQYRRVRRHDRRRGGHLRRVLFYRHVVPLVQRDRMRGCSRDRAAVESWTRTAHPTRINAPALSTSEYPGTATAWFLPGPGPLCESARRRNPLFAPESGRSVSA